MNTMGKLLDIYISEVAVGAMSKVRRADLEAGKGIRGDRYHSGTGTFSAKLSGLPDRELTLIESEQIAWFNRTYHFDFDYGDFRRNCVTEGVDLNALAGREFRLGGVLLRGIRLCEPCAHLAGLLTPDILPALLHRCGLRAQILEGGSIFPGDPIALP